MAIEGGSYCGNGSSIDKHPGLNRIDAKIGSDGFNLCVDD